jgi:hypothetical protein
LSRQLVLATLLIGTAGCSWSRLADSRPVSARGTVQVWSSGQAVLLRDPKTVGDSLVGLEPLPDSTRHAVALSDIDSLRTQTADPGKIVIVGTAVAIAALSAYTAGLGGN